MTADEYKKQHPEHKDLEGNALWDAMEDAMLRQQSGQVYINHMLPWYKRYKLRYLFYVRKPNAMFINPDEYHTRCKNCKKGSTMSMFMMDFSGQTPSVQYCIHCGKVLETEPNTSLRYKWLKFKKEAKEIGWKILEFTHLFRYSCDGRYDLFGDESQYVSRWIIKNDGTETPIFRKRKWWEYIVIEKR